MSYYSINVKCVKRKFGSYNPFATKCNKKFADPRRRQIIYFVDKLGRGVSRQIIHMMAPPEMKKAQI